MHTKVSKWGYVKHHMHHIPKDSLKRGWGGREVCVMFEQVQHSRTLDKVNFTSNYENKN